jgi:hypothetical protein
VVGEVKGSPGIETIEQPDRFIFVAVQEIEKDQLGLAHQVMRALAEKLAIIEPVLFRYDAPRSVVLPAQLGVDEGFVRLYEEAHLLNASPIRGRNVGMQLLCPTAKRPLYIFL